MSAALLQQVTISRLDDGRWKVTRERAENGETLIADDLIHALDVVLVAYRPDGTPRPVERRKPKRRLLRDWPQVGEHEGGRTVLCSTLPAATGTGEEGKARA